MLRRAIMELPAVVVATLLSILYHLIWGRKIDTFRICGTKVPTYVVRWVNRINVTASNLIEKSAVADANCAFWELAWSERAIRNQFLLTQNIFYVNVLRKIAILGNYVTRRESRRKDEEVKGGRGTFASAVVLIPRGTLRHDNYGYFIYPNHSLSQRLHSICGLSCVQLFLHTVGGFPLLFSRHVWCTSTPPLFFFFFFSYHPYSPSCSFSQSNQCRLPRETSVEKRGRVS